jgi:leader peptidase (prepilin peptidase) / N-methyltransferase
LSVHGGTRIHLSPDFILTVASYFPLLFVFAFGASVGSLLNVLVYRLPRGEGVVFPASRCPSCGTGLTWRENIPIVGWLVLRGRCRFCKSRISPEYPIVEAFVAVLFTATAFLWYVVPWDAAWLGVHWGGLRPEWAVSGIGLTWPMLGLVYLLLGCLVAMTLIDARTFTIPMVLTWVPAVGALAIHPLHAAWIQVRHGSLPFVAPGWTWTIPTPGWVGLGAAVGGCVGLGIGLGLLRLGWIGRSFADYEAWERSVNGGGGAEGAAVGGGAGGGGVDADNGEDPTHLWVQYPHARREMVRELAFLAPCVVLMLVGAWVGEMYFAANQRPNPDPFLPPLGPGMPLWLEALGGVLLGYVVGGGVVWAVRIGGSLAFGKEAMGLGDVHLMAAVGACLGWIDATLAFFLAAFVGMAWWVLGAVVGGGRLPRTIPYGPYLAVATLLVIWGKPWLEWGLTRMLNPGEGGMPINIP